MNKIKIFCFGFLFFYLSIAILIFIIDDNLNESKNLLLASQNSIFSWIEDFFNFIGYHYFILPLTWLVHSLSEIIIFISKSNFLNMIIFQNKNNLFKNNSFYLWAFVASFCLLIFIIVYKFFKMMTCNYFKQKEMFKNILKQIAFILILTPLIPFLFYSVNFIITLVLTFLKINDSKNNVALIIFNCSFLNQIHDLKKIPQHLQDFDYEHLSFILCFFSLLVVTYCLFKIVIKLIVVCLEIFWLLAFSFFVVFASLASEYNNSNLVKNHLNLTIQRWAIFVFFISSFAVFKSNFHFLTFLALHSSLKGSSQVLFLIVLILASSFLILEVPILISYLMSGSTLLNPYLHNSRFFSKFLILKNLKNKTFNKLSKWRAKKNSTKNSNNSFLKPKKFVLDKNNSNFNLKNSNLNNFKLNNKTLNNDLKGYW